MHLKCCFVSKRQSELGLGRTDFDGPVAVLAVHQNRPLEMKLEILKQKTIFSTKKV